MKDIPVFTTQNGAAALMLQQIPYTKRAYVTVHDSEALDALLTECREFCVAVGAEEVYACNHPGLTRYPVAAQMLWMEADRPAKRANLATLCPLTEDAVQRFKTIYNKKMAQIPASQWITSDRLADWEKLGKCYFVERMGTVIGIGIVSGNEIRALASLVPGGGKDVVSALIASVEMPNIKLQVASTNHKALRLYTALGFKTIAVENTWYKI